jgi:DNA-binding transcriptional ArsR family regulator
MSALGRPGATMPRDPGIDQKGERMTEAMNLEQKQREEARWRILRVLDAGRPVGVSENIVWRVLGDIKLRLSPNAVRRELTYLRDLGLVKIENEDSEIWFAELTAEGVDVVEYTVNAPPGVARPRKYW